MVQSSPRASRRRTARRLRVPHTSVGTTLHAEGMYPYRVQRVQHLGPGDFAERLEFCKWLNGNRKYIVTACLLTNRNSIATVSIIQTIHMCGQLRITMPLCKATFNNVLVSKSGVQFWTISCLAISSWKVVIQEKRTSDFCKRNCPEVWRMCF